MSSTTAANTIKVLQEIFAMHGLPEQHVSDNGPHLFPENFLISVKLME